MKNFKKILCGVLSVTALSTCLVIPTSAEVVYDDIQTTTDEGGHISYQLPDDFTIQTVVDDEDQTLVLNGKKFKLVEIYTKNHNQDAILPEDKIDFMYYFSEEGNEDERFVYPLMSVNIYPENERTDKELFVEVNLDASEPDNKDDLTIGNSEATGVRGDINYDGKVTTVDLLLLKKYLLGIVKW